VVGLLVKTAPKIQKKKQLYGGQIQALREESANVKLQNNYNLLF